LAASDKKDIGSFLSKDEPKLKFQRQKRRDVIFVYGASQPLTTSCKNSSGEFLRREEALLEELKTKPGPFGPHHNGHGPTIFGRGRPKDDGPRLAYIEASGRDYGGLTRKKKAPST
jgi:hypothetical protein